MELLCPLCGGVLENRERAMLCPNGHSFDIARQGYVNLLPVQHKRSLQPGDTREQVLARRAFLEGGYYRPIAQALCRMAEHANGPILDVGCGEGYYSAQLAEAMEGELVGLDISKEAVRYAAGRYKNARWLCASAARLPVKDGSVGLLTSLFAITLPEEFRRVLRPDGCFIQVLAAEDHLLGLKSLIYGELTHKEKNTAPVLPGFILEESRPVRFSFTVEAEQVKNLLYMTPPCVPDHPGGRGPAGGDKSSYRYGQLRGEPIPTGSPLQFLQRLIQYIKYVQERAYAGKTGGGGKPLRRALRPVGTAGFL